MGLRFQSEFSNIRRELYKVEIHDSEFSGSVTEFVLRGDGFHLQYQGGEQTYDLIKSSTLSFVMSIDNATLKAFPTDIVTSEPERFTIKVYKDQTYDVGNGFKPDGAEYELYWLGYINKRIMSMADSFYPFDFRVSAVDGIQDLKNKDYQQSDGTPFTERLSLVKILTGIIDKLDVGNSISASDLPLATLMKWFEVNHPSISDDPCAKTYLYQNAFEKVTNDNEIKFSNYYDVLNHICTLFQCRFVHSRGKYFFTQFERLTESLNLYYLYKLDGTTDASELTESRQYNLIYGEYNNTSYATRSTASSASAGFFSRTKTFGEKLQSVKIEWGLGSSNIYPLNYFPVWEMPSANWNKYGSGLTGPNLVGYFESGDEINFKLKIKMKLRVTRQANVTPSGSFYGKIKMPFWLKVSDSNSFATVDRYWRPSLPSADVGVIPPTEDYSGNTNWGSWVDQDVPTENTAIMMESGIIYMSSSTSAGTIQEFDFDVTINTSDSSVPEAAGVFLYNDYDGNWASGLGSGDWYAVEKADGTMTSWDDSQWDGYKVEPIFEEITLLSYKEGLPFTGSIVDSYVTEDDDSSDNPQELVIDNTIFSDGPSANGKKVIWINDGSSIIQSNLWKVNGIGTGYKIHKLITDEILKFNYQAGVRLQATMIEPPISYHAKVNEPTEGYARIFYDEDGDWNSNEVYAFTKLDYNANKAEWAFKGRMIGPIVSPIVVTNPSPPIFDNTGLVGSPYSGAIHESLASYDKFSTLDEEISPDDTGITSLRVAAMDYEIPSGKEFLIQSNSPSYSYERVTLSSAYTKGETSISIDAWTPLYTYDSKSKILPSSNTLASLAEPAGSNTEIQFNDGGTTLGASSSLTFNDATDTLTSGRIVSIGDIDSGGNFLGDNIGTIYSGGLYKYMYLVPQDFLMSSSGAYNARGYSSSTGASVKFYNHTYDYMATFQLPLGYKVIEVSVKGNSPMTFSIGVSSWSSAMGGVLWNGNVNTPLTITGTAIETVMGNYWTLKLNPTSTTNMIYGCQLTLEEI